jgi:hypothetical protein
LISNCQKIPFFHEFFSGNLGASAAQWFEYFDQVALLNGWSSEQKLKLLPLFLDGGAKILYERNKGKSFGAIQKTLCMAYGRDNVIMVRALLSRKRQSPGQSIIEYLVEITKLCEKAKMGSDQEIISQVVSTSLPYIQRALQYRCEGISMDNFITLAREAEDLEWRIEQDQHQCETTLLIESEQAKTKTNRWEPPKSPKNRGSSNNRTSRFSKNRKTRTIDGRPICNYCRNPGHVKNQCFLWKRKLSGPSGNPNFRKKLKKDD